MLAAFLIVCLLLGQPGGILTFGAGPGTAHADVLSGANSTTLIREPQQTPDGLGAAGLNGLQYADPAARIDLVQPPVANNQGDAEVNLPLSVPPGRMGVQPNLALSYSSTGSNGWLGLGWDLPFDMVTIDTRWGVPRYSATQETETYLLDGSQLSPTAIRSSFEPRTAEKKFQRRTEGSFERILRHGSAPGSYWWEVTDKTARGVSTAAPPRAGATPIPSWRMPAGTSLSGGSSRAVTSTATRSPTPTTNRPAPELACTASRPGRVFTWHPSATPGRSFPTRRTTRPTR